MKKIVYHLLLLQAFMCLLIVSYGQNKTVKHGPKYDTIIVKRQPKVIKQPLAKKVIAEIVLPTPEFVNQPCYYDQSANKLIPLENSTALLVTKKKVLGLKGAKQSLSIEEASSKIRFVTKKDISFFIRTSGDVIDLTSYVRLYKFLPANQKREATITTKEGLINDKDDAKGKLMNFSVKMTAKDVYQVQLANELEAGEYGFVWVKNMELKEFTVYAFGIDWKNSD